MQAFIKKKTSNLNKYIQLKGKLEMAKRTLDIKPAKHLSKAEPLVYKDASDVSDGEISSEDQAMSDEEAEEELKDIPLG